MNVVVRMPRSISVSTSVAVMLLAWAAEVLAQMGIGQQQQQQKLAPPAVAAGIADGPESPLVVLTREDQRVEEVTTNAKDSTPKSVKRSETHSKRQVAVRVRTEIVHPTPQIRHATATYQPIYPERTAAEGKLYEVLDHPLPERWELAEAPLRVVQRMIVGQFQIPCDIDARALEDYGLDLDTPITVNLERMSLRSALRQLLGNVELAFLIKNETLLITTIDKADTHLEIVLYPLPTAHSAAELIDLIQSTVAADTWDSVGGQGAIRTLLTSSEFVVSQTLEVHEQIAKFMARFDADLEPTAGNQAPPAMRCYSVRDPQAFAELQVKLVATCNAALGDAADLAARVSAVGGKLVVQSASRPFHVYAAELVRSVNGVESVRQEIYPEQTGFETGMGAGFGAGGMGGFCWVAREVYGEHDPRWIVFRAWLLNEAPACLRDNYARHGEWFAAWLRRNPAAKAVLRPLMDAAISRPAPAPSPR